MPNEERVPSGIPGLDELIEGGYIPGSVIMLSGGTGTGKTIFCTQYIWNALCLGENGVFVTLQQTPEEIRKDVARFGRDFETAEKNDQCRIVYLDPQDLKKIINTIMDNIKEINAKRLAIDSISLVGEYIDHIRTVRKDFSYLIRQLKKMKVTTVMTSEIPEGTELISRFGIEEFLVDGVIVLKCGVDVVGGKPRSMIIRKMRRTKHDLDTHPFMITDHGIKIVK